MIIKNPTLLQAVVGSLAVQAAGHAGFFPVRQHVTQLTSLDVEGGARYVWRKVFLRSRRGM